MTKEQALDVVREAAKSWADELSQYIIPASEAAEDGATDGYYATFDAINEALRITEDLALLLP